MDCNPDRPRREAVRKAIEEAKLKRAADEAYIAQRLAEKEQGK